MENGNLSTKVLIGKVRASYAHVFTPSSMNTDGSDPKYSVSLIIPKSEVELVAKIKKAIEAAYAAGLASKWQGVKPGRCHNPLRDGDEERSDKPEYADCYFINASCKGKPGVTKYLGKKVVDGKKVNNIAPITDEDEFYSGCWIYASVNFFAFNTSGSKGIACGLNNVMKVEDGEMLGGRSSAESDFGDMDLPESEDPFAGAAPDDDFPF